MKALCFLMVLVMTGCSTIAPSERQTQTKNPISSSTSQISELQFESYEERVYRNEVKSGISPRKARADAEVKAANLFPCYNPTGNSNQLDAFGIH